MKVLPRTVDVECILIAIGHIHVAGLPAVEISHSCFIDSLQVFIRQGVLSLLTEIVGEIRQLVLSSELSHYWAAFLRLIWYVPNTSIYIFESWSRALQGALIKLDFVLLISVCWVIVWLFNVSFLSALPVQLDLFIFRHPAWFLIVFKGCQVPACVFIFIVTGLGYRAEVLVMCRTYVFLMQGLQDSCSFFSVETTISGF